MIFYVGAQLSIVYARGAAESRADAEEHIPPNQSACIANMNALLRRLADHRKLSTPDQFRMEGEGIWAVKTRCGLRAYGFYARGGKFVISHFAMKQRQKMDPADLQRAIETKKRWME